MKDAIKMLQQDLVLLNNRNALSLSQLQRYEKMLRALIDLEYDVSKSNMGLPEWKATEGAMQQMPAVSNE